jgi:ABC-type lipoprotein export system ATPase subunit
MLLDVQHIKKVYRTRGNETIALRDIHFSVQAGEFVAIMGESGSGKSTLLNIIATYDKPTEGKLALNNQDLSKIRAKEIAKFRREALGFVFQDFNVLDTFNNKDNILLPLVLSDVPVKEMEPRLNEISKFLGIQDFLNKYPYEISGGQRQRIAIARALINGPQLILADEPTGNLDSATSEQILEVLQNVNKAGNTILMVTHSLKAASKAKRVLFIRDGIIFHEIYRGQTTSQEFQERIADSISVLNERGERE